MEPKNPSVQTEPAEVEILRAVLADGDSMDDLAAMLKCTPSEAGDIYRESKLAMLAKLDDKPGTPTGDEVILFIRKLPALERKIAFEHLLVRTSTVTEMAKALNVPAAVAFKLLGRIQVKKAIRFPNWK